MVARPSEPRSTTAMMSLPPTLTSAVVPPPSRLGPGCRANCCPLIFMTGMSRPRLSGKENATHTLLAPRAHTIPTEVAEATPFTVRLASVRRPVERRSGDDAAGPARLQSVEALVESAAVDQLPVCPPLAHLAVMEDQDLRCIHNRAQSMGDGDRRPTLQENREGPLNI